MIYGVAKRLLFLLDAERAHDLVAAQLERVGRHPRLASMLFGGPEPSARLARTLFGMTFRNPLGIAAGFDKNARMIDALDMLGFGFIEIGTVTLHPQPGNPKPRMFRYRTQEALVNRLGFNNEGADAVARRLEATWERRSRSGRLLPPLFVNIGKNKDVAASDAVSAYRSAYRILAPLADGVVVNVSSPNTPGLRDLQQSESLEQIIGGLREERERLNSRRGSTNPILVKIAPDLDERQLEAIALVCKRHAHGVTATNTTIEHSALPAGRETGGLSGRPLFARSTDVVRKLRSLVGDDFPIIGVGGIFDAADVVKKMEAGANLVQAYTALVYEGPQFAHRVVRELEKE